MKFKVLKGTPTFAKTEELQEKAKAARKAASDLIGIITGTSEDKSRNMAYYPENEFAGGIRAIIFDTPVPQGWGKTKYNSNAYYPLKRKANAEIRQKIAELPIVTKQEFNDIVGFEPQFDEERARYYFSPGYLPFPDYFLLDINNHCKFTPNEDMIEILESEYIKLSERNQG